MLTRKAVTAYCTACVLAFVSLALGGRVMQVPWLSNGRGETIGLWRFSSDEGSVKFPGRRLCQYNSTFCANWRTATFALALSLVPEALVLASLLFSWAFHHRKKTVLVTKCLLVASLVLNMLGIVLWRFAYADLSKVLGNSHYYLVGGWHLVVYSWAANAMLLALMVPFRSIVSSDPHAMDSDSDDDESTPAVDADNISVPEDIPAEQIDFYVFRKQARRQELARRGG